MSEKAKELQKKLFNKKENGVDFMSDEELKACDDFCEGYKKFLFENKTEREFAASALKLAQEHGFLEFDKFGKALEPGDKVYYFNREICNNTFSFMPHLFHRTAIHSLLCVKEHSHVLSRPISPVGSMSPIRQIQIFI